MLIAALQEYSRTITPWANAVARVMLADVFRRDRAMWRSHSKMMGAALRRQVESAPVGDIFSALQQQQVGLITSIPTEAAERVHALAQEAVLSSKRASVVARAILATEDVSKAKATVIARTEVSRATSNLVEARAVWAGSDGYFWRTSGDADVRPSHKEMEGIYVRWSQPPTLDKMVGHAGCFPNCRCFAEPVFPGF